MYRVGNPYTVGFLVTAAFMFVLAAVTVRHRSRRLALPLAGFLAAAGLWVLADGLRMAAPTRSHVLLWQQVSYVGAFSIVPTYLFFVAVIANHEWVFRRRVAGALAGISALALVVSVTNPIHGLWLREATVSPGTVPPVFVPTWGPAWMLWAAYVYLLAVPVGIWMLVTDLLHSNRPRLYRSQVALVLVGIVVPTLANLLFNVFGVFRFDPLPITMSVTGIAFTVAIYRYDLLDITPIARDVVLSNLDNGVVVLNTEDLVVDTNRRAREVLEIEDAEVPGLDLDEVLAGYPDVTEQVRAVQDGRETVTVETDAGPRYYELQASPLRDDLGTRLGRAVVFTEVTDRIERERTLRERAARLERQTERFDELTSMISHDLQTPLDTSRNYAKLLRSKVATADLPEEVASEIETDIQGIERATTRAAEISEELLVLSRDTAEPESSVTVETEPVSLRVVAADAWAAVDTGDLELAVHESRTVRADDSELRRLLENCFRNVVEHAEGATRVVVGTTPDAFYVEDDGDGFPEPVADRAFEPGYTTSTEGSGLGLSIVAEIAANHGWSVDVTVGETGGTRIEVMLDPVHSTADTPRADG